MKKRILSAALTCTVLGTSLLGATPVLANDYDSQIEQAQQKVAENEQAASGLDTIINQLSNQVANTQEAVHSISAEIEQNEAALETALTELETANKEMNTLLEEIAALEENIANRSIQLEQQARMVQVNGNPTNYFEFILDSESLTDVIGRIDIVTNLVKSSNSMIEDQIKDQQAVEEKSEETERKITQQNAIAGELEKTSEELEVQKISQIALVAQLELEKNSASSNREELIAERNAALAQVDSIANERESVRLAAAEAERELAEQEAQEVQVTQAELEEPQQTTAEIPTVTPASSGRESNVTPATSSQESTSNESNSNSGNESSSTRPSTPEPAPTPAPAPSTPAPAPKPKPKPKPEPKPAPKPATPAPSGNVLSIGAKYLGVPYLWAGTTPGGFDCSGFTQLVFKQAGKSIPRNTRSQYASSQKVSSPRAGDLVFFSNARNGRIDHVGIVVGNGQFIGSQSSTGVAYASLTSGYWAASGRIIGYGRY